ncbi:MAG TPA: SDR family NAD(P)-dependent oxidoreductase [Flavisolibacter sp.]|nr:SDR family NAD(P)-dependent oxidoreductase [Flavisolibacter sp.]
MNRKQFLSMGATLATGALMPGAASIVQSAGTFYKDASFKGKTAFITGAARGIGLATALELARLGANIALVDIADRSGAGMAIDGYRLSGQEDLDAALRQVQALGVKAMAIRADVRDLSAMKVGARQAALELGGIDIVVANAGIVAWSTIEGSGEKQWKDVIDVNINGVVNTVWATIGELKKSKAGRIITLSSIGGRMGVVGNGAYSTTKWAVIGLTKSLALELGKYGITVNAVAPTAVNTPMYRSEGQVRSTGMSSASDQDKAMLGYHALGVPAVEPEDIAAAIAYLASEGARYVSGLVLDVAAGGNAHYSA